MIVILDYGVGNVTSIQKMLHKAGAEAIITGDENLIKKAEKFILPGVGSFDHGITNLRNTSYFETLNRKVLDEKVPIMGVCLGVQLFSESSEEGSEKGLGWIKGKTVRFNPELMADTRLKIPHMDWTDVYSKKPSKLLTGMYGEPRFYFVHSFHLQCDHPEDILMSANYGYEFVAGVERENIIGVQFHPEKSHKFGLKIYENFIKYY